MKSVNGAEAKPEHGAPQETPLLSGSIVKNTKLFSPGMCYQEFNISEYFSFFRKTKNDFITLRCNKGKRYQEIDSVRKLLARSYDHYVLVGSPTGGRHWHAVATGLKKPLRVPRGVHYHKSRVGYINVSRANRKPREDPLSGDASVYSQLRYVVGKVPATAQSKGRSSDDHLIDVLLYLFENLRENREYSRYGNFAARF